MSVPCWLQMKAGLGTLGKEVKDGEKSRPALAVLAEDIGKLARDERANFSPILQQWHLTPAGVAAAALHSCFGKELRKYVSTVTGISPDGVQVLMAADQLEMDLVQIAAEDGANADDGGKSLIREMPPYEAQSILDALSKKWVEEGIGRLAQWADRNVQNEVVVPSLSSSVSLSLLSTVLCGRPCFIEAYLYEYTRACEDISRACQ
jgi:hypothetical protein